MAIGKDRPGAQQGSQEETGELGVKSCRNQVGLVYKATLTPFPPLLLSSWEAATLKQVEGKDAIGHLPARSHSPLYPDVGAVVCTVSKRPENPLLLQVFLKP